MPTISRGGDHNDLQDLYRQSVAASLFANPNEFTAEECIEDIFNGGDGWKGGWPDSKDKSKTKPRIPEETTEYRAHHMRNKSDSSLKSQSTIKGHTRLGHKHSRSQDLRHGSGISTPPEEPTSK